MNAKAVAAFFAVLMVVSCAVFAECSDDSSAFVCDDINVYIQNESGGYDMSVVDGVGSVKEIVLAAVADQGKEITLNSRGNISSIGGLGADQGRWRIFQWLPLGTNGWGMQTFSMDSDLEMATGATYCLTISTVSAVDGSIVYTEPDFRPESTGYVFIRFANGYFPDVPEIQEAFTTEIREEGFWLEGHGATLGEVVYDAVSSNGFEVEMWSGGSGGNDLSCWITSMFGIGDESLGGNAWAYWSQWTWVDNFWMYNNWTLGYYDPAVFPYVECIYLISTPDPYGDDYEIDKGGPDPDPVADGVHCISNNLTATFLLDDGTVWDEQHLRWGGLVDLKSVKDPAKEGMVFVGWGDVTDAVYEDVVFTAQFIEEPVYSYKVTYYLSDGVTPFYSEYVTKGEAAVFDGSPSKQSDAHYDYTFAGWDVDLSRITADTDARPVYDSEAKLYEVRFHDYDRTYLGSRFVEYGCALEDYPEEPSRERTVKYGYEFVCWSITPYGNNPADLDEVKSTLFVFAYYAPQPRMYTVTFHEGDDAVAELQIGYGSNIGRTVPMDMFKGECLVKMFRDPGMTEEYSVAYTVIGDTDVYIQRIPGSYDSERDASGEAVGGTVSVSFDGSNTGALKAVDGKAVLCDISQFPDGTVASIDLESLETVREHLGDVVAVIKVPRGALSMRLSDMLDVMDGGEELTFSVGNGPVGVKINSALKRISYDYFYSVSVKVDGLSVTDFSGLGSLPVVSLLSASDGSASPSAWSITSKGTAMPLDCASAGRFIDVTADTVQFIAVGTSGGSQADASAVVVPYGEMEFEKTGSHQEDDDPDTDDYASTLLSMSIDNRGETLFVPSAIEAYPLKTVSFGAFNGVMNAPSVVIPPTVSLFYWEAWSNSSIKDVYFLGDCPDFSGDVPAGVTVHCSPGASGWDGIGAVDDLSVMTYDGAHKKDAFSFTYYMVDGVVAVHRYITGDYVCIPSAIAVDGTERPVRYVGDASFMRTDNSSLYDLYGLEYTNYNLQTVEFTSEVTDVMTRAFYGSTVVSVIALDAAVHLWDEAFKDCRFLAGFTLPESLVYMGRSCFRGCDGRSFTRVALPDSLLAMGDESYYACSNLINVSFGNGLAEIPADCFASCGRLSDLEFGSSIASIGRGAFSDCPLIRFIDLRNVEDVGPNAFNQSSAAALDCIVFSENVKTVGKGAFGGYSSIGEVDVYCEKPEGFEEAFSPGVASSLMYYIDPSVAESWSDMPNQEVIADDSAPIEEIDYAYYVTLGLIAFFIVLGAIAVVLRIRR